MDAHVLSPRIPADFAQNSFSRALFRLPILFSENTFFFAHIQKGAVQQHNPMLPATPQITGRRKKLSQQISEKSVQIEGVAVQEPASKEWNEFPTTTAAQLPECDYILDDSNQGASRLPKKRHGHKPFVWMDQRRRTQQPAYTTTIFFPIVYWINSGWDW